MANKIYQHDESAVTWLSSGGTEALTLTSVANAAGRQGAHHDFGTSARARRFVWRAWLKANAAPTVGNTVDIYLKTSDGSHPDNDDGTGDIAVSTIDKLRNLKWIGAIVYDEASSTPEFASSGEIEISARYGAPVIWNGGGVTLSGTAADHGFSLTPVPDEIQ